MGRARAVGKVRSSGRELILREMLKLVGEVGYEETTVGMVLGRCGVSERTFELEFIDKEDCFLAAFEFGVGLLEAGLVEAAMGESSWLGKFRAGLGALVEFLDAEPEIGRALLVEAQLAGREAQARSDETMERAARLIDLARVEGDGFESPPEIAPRAVVAGIYGMLHSRLASGTGDGVGELMPDLVYYAVLPYFGSEVAVEEMAAARIG